MTSLQAREPHRHQATLSEWVNARADAYASGDGPEFDRLCCEIKACQQSLAAATCEATKTEHLRHLTVLVRERAALLAPSTTEVPT